MAHRQVETNSIHQSNFHTGYIRTSPESSWEIVAHNSNHDANDPTTATDNGDVLPCTYLDLATHIHLHGSEQRMKQGFPVFKSLRWNKDVHFHDSLRLPSGGSAASEKGIVVVFEGTIIVFEDAFYIYIYIYIYI